MPIFAINHLNYFQSSFLYLVKVKKERKEHETKNPVIYAYDFINSSTSKMISITRS